MAGASTNRWLIIGESGSGKSRLAADLIDRYRRAGKRRHVVMLTLGAASESELTRHARAVVELDDDAAAQPISYRALIEAEQRVLFEVTTVDPSPALERIAGAVMELGNTLIVIDEAAELVNQRAPQRVLSLWTRGRVRCVDIIAIAQSIKQRPALGLNAVAINRSTVLVAFQFSDSNELADLRTRFPHTGDMIQALRSPRDGKAPEYAVRDALTGRECVYLREGPHIPQQEATQWQPQP